MYSWHSFAICNSSCAAVSCELMRLSLLWIIHCSRLHRLSGNGFLLLVNLALNVIQFSPPCGFLSFCKFFDSSAVLNASEENYSVSFKVIFASCKLCHSSTESYSPKHESLTHLKNWLPWMINLVCWHKSETHYGALLPFFYYFSECSCLLWSTKEFIVQCISEDLSLIFPPVVNIKQNIEHYY